VADRTDFLPHGVERAAHREVRIAPVVLRTLHRHRRHAGALKDRCRHLGVALGPSRPA
jgi:hypothetical protein